MIGVHNMWSSQPSSGIVTSIPNGVLSPLNPAPSNAGKHKVLALWPLIWIHVHTKLKGTKQNATVQYWNIRSTQLFESDSPAYSQTKLSLPQRRQVCLELAFGGTQKLTIETLWHCSERHVWGTRTIFFVYALLQNWSDFHETPLRCKFSRPYFCRLCTHARHNCFADPATPSPTK